MNNVSFLKKKLNKSGKINKNKEIKWIKIEIIGNINIEIDR